MQDKKMIGSLNPCMKGPLLSALLLFLFALPSTSHAQAKAGDLDASFGIGGKVFTPSDLASVKIRIQPDGKVVTVATDSWEGFSTITRHNSDGTLDRSFRDPGLDLSYPYFWGESFNDFVIQADGKLLIAGNVHVPRVGYALFRFNSDGTQDPTFGNNGVVLASIQLGSGSISNTIAIQPDGKVITTGLIWSSNGKTDTVILRHRPDGSPDLSFGKNGAVIELEGGSPHELVLQPDGKVVIALNRCNISFCAAFMARFHSDGSRDQNFGTGGLVDLQMHPAGGLKLQTDGKLVVNGSNGIAGTMVKRLHANGTPDLGFGENGVVNASISSVAAEIDANGRILVAGKLNGAYAVSRYNSNGSPDLSFGQGGLVLTPLENSSGWSVLSSMAIQEDGRILTSGHYWNSSEGGAGTSVMRYLADGPGALRRVSGRVITPDGRGLRSATVTITDQMGVARSATTSSLGFFTISDLTDGNYVLRTSSKQYRFLSRSIGLSGNLDDVDMVGIE